MDKQVLLDKIKIEINNCQTCKKDKTGKMVFGEGNPDAHIVFVGEAPGKEEAKTGRPFIGRSGKLLRFLISELGLKEKEVYITSPVKYLPDRGTPSKEDIKHAITHFQKQLSIINPKLVVLLGKSAIRAVLNKDIPVIKEHGKTVKKDNQVYFLTLHPAAAIRFVKNKKIIEQDFKTLKSLIKGIIK